MSMSIRIINPHRGIVSWCRSRHRRKLPLRRAVGGRNPAMRAVGGRVVPWGRRNERINYLDTQGHMPHEKPQQHTQTEAFLDHVGRV